MDSEQIKVERSALYAHFALDEHKIREGYTSYGKTTWFVYIDSEPIQARLDELFFMEWELTYSDYPTIQDGYVAIAATLKIRGMSRTGSGGQGLNGQKTVSEDTVKGAYTDAFKRAAAKWGIGMYMTVCPKLVTESYPDKNWSMRDFRQAEAWAQFVSWYDDKPYVAPVMPGQQRQAPKVATQKPTQQPQPENGHGEPPASTPQTKNVATVANAFPDKASAQKFIRSWVDSHLSSDDILAALGVQAYGAYQGTLAEATAAVNQLLLNRAVEF